MTPERLAQIRSDLADMRRERAAYRGCPVEMVDQTVAEELLDGLESERARLDWLIRYIETPDDDRPPFFVVMIGVPAAERAEKWRDCIDSARE